ncbi:MAG: GTP-binding protein, partial [Candidatus Heimdallarchaeota archaeon]|nr:GTP-binding protein [Candidatus Heimdallarchaeota archaeon]
MQEVNLHRWIRKNGTYVSSFGGSIITKSLSCKVCLLGDGNVGKTSLRRRYLGEGFKDTYALTIGADFAAKRVNINSWKITCNIWDLAGQSRFKKLRETYYRGVSGVLCVYDISRRDTLEIIPKWIEELLSNNENKLVPMVLIGNKADLKKEQEDFITTEEGIAFAKRMSELYHQDIIHIESSAKTGENVEKAFISLIE